MSDIAIFPWLKIKSDIDLGKVKLIQYKRGKKPCNDQDIYDSVIGIYKRGSDKPIDEATLVLLENKPNFEDFSEEERAFLYFISEIIAFSGLSKRKYFETPLGQGYCNSDNFTIFIKGLGQEARATIKPKRKDHFPLYQSVKDAYMPYHVYICAGNRIELDIPLIEALIKARDSLCDESWTLYREAIFLFNLANTDNDAISPYQEIVLTVSAYERLFGLEHGKENALVCKFLDTFEPQQDFDLSNNKKLENVNNPPPGNTLREIWIRDLFRLRNDYAHGNLMPTRSGSKYTDIVWKKHEHLLLSSYVFPLVVKCKLREEGFYKFNDDGDCQKMPFQERDSFNIDVFERLLDADLFVQDGSGNPVYNAIRYNYYIGDFCREKYNTKFKGNTI